MPAIPNFVLKKLYVKESLRNTPAGTEFSLVNNVANATATRFYGLRVDRVPCPLERLVVVLPDGEARPLAEVLPEAPCRSQSAWRLLCA